MDRGAAHAAIVLILHQRWVNGRSFSGIADDILDAIWPDTANVWAQGYIAGMNDEAEGHDPHAVVNPYSAQPP